MAWSICALVKLLRRNSTGDTSGIAQQTLILEEESGFNLDATERGASPVPGAPGESDQ